MLQGMNKEQYFKNYLQLNPPVSELSRKVANLTERKIHMPLYGVNKFVCLSVCLSVCYKDDLNFHLTGTKNHLKKSLQLWLPSCFLMIYFFSNF